MAREKAVTEGNPKEAEQILLPSSAAKKIFESTGENYFRTITEVIVKEMDLGLDYCVVAELIGVGKVRTIAFYAVDRFMENAEYTVEDTPCRFVVGRKPCIYLRDVQKLFPEALLLTQMQAQSYIGVPPFSSDGSPLGLMAALGRKPLPRDKQERITALLQILAAGVVGELERKRKDDALRTSEENYRAIFDSANDGIFIHDFKTGDVVALNRKASEMYGYTPGEFRHFINDSLFTGMPGYTAQDALKRIRSAAQGPPQVFEWLSKRKDGRLFWVEVSLKRAVIGGVTRLLAIVRDITDRKRAEEVLKLTQFSVDHAAVSAFLLDKDARLLYVNDEACRTLGYIREELLRMTVGDLDPDSVSEWDKHWSQLKHDGRVHYQRMHRRKDGTHFPVDVSGNYVSFGGREYNWSFAVDISERKRAEQQKQRAMALLEEAQHIAGIGNWEWDRVTNRVTWSNEVYRIFGLQPGEFKETFAAFIEMVHPEDRQRVENNVSQASRERRENSFNEFRIIRPDGTIRIVHTKSRFLYDDRGVLTALRGTSQDVTEARRTEKSLKLTQFAVDRASVSAFISTPEGRILYANEEASRSTRYSRAELLSMTIPDIDPIMPRSKWSAHWDQLKREGSLHFESMHRKKDGAVFPVDVSVNYLSFGGREYDVGFALDISERKKAEQQLLESEERFRQLAENTKEIFWFMTPDPERVLYVNPAFESICGRRPEELYRNPRVWAEVIHPDERDVVEKAFWEWASGMSEKFDMEYRIVRPDGGIRWIHDRGTMIRDVLGRVVRLSGIADDITERKKIEQEIEKTKAQLEEAQQIAGIGNWEWDRRTDRLTWSAELYRIFNTRQGEFGETLGALMQMVHPDDRPRIEKNISEASAQQKESSFNEYRIIRPDGQTRILHTRSRFLYDRTGSLIGMRGTAQDVTEMRRAEEALKLTQFSVDHASVSAFIIDQDARILYANEQASRGLGYSREELVSMRITDIDPNFPFSIWGEHWENLKKEGHLHFESLHRRKDGSIMPVDTSVNYLYYSGREYNIGFALDISERKRAENSLQQYSKLTDTIIDSINDPISLIDVRDFTLVRVNKVFLEKYGYSDQSEVAGKHCYEITHHRPDVCSAPNDICPLIETVKTREHFAADHIHYKRRGEKVYVEVSTSPIRDEAGNVIQVVHVQRDVTERKKAEEALRLSEARFRNLFKQSSLSMQILSPEGRTVEVNHAWEELWGLKPEAVKDYNILRDEQLIAKGIMPYVQKGFTGEATEVPVVFYDPSEIDHSGQGRCVKGFIYPVKTGDGRIHELVLMHVDVTESVKAEEALRESEERFRAFFELAAVGAAEVNPVTGRFLRVNDRFCSITGYSREEMLSRTFKDITHPDDREADAEFFARVVAGGAGEYDVEKRYVHKDGRTVWVHVSAAIVRNKRGRPLRTAGIVQDITERKRMEEEIRHMAHHDSLTGLPNRRLFRDIITIELAQAQRNKKKVAVLFLDLDRFKEINDTLGHQAGDLLLKEVALRLKALLRKSDSISRIGGDEFNIVLADVARVDDISDIAKKLVGSFKKPFLISGHTLHVSASIGISVYPDDSDQIDALLRYSDIAMYHSKESGRNTYRFYDSSINIRSIERMRLENMLLRSLELDEMGIYYQPQINISDRRIVCAEALIRWNHPQRGVLLPDDFIPLAEETGFITTIDEFVLTAVCRQVRAWLDAGLPRVCVTVNLSSRQFESAELIDKIGSILKETGLPAGCLDIEITESMAMSNVERSAERGNWQRWASISRLTTSGPDIHP